MARQNNDTKVATSATKPAAERRKGRKASAAGAPKLGLVADTGRLTELRPDVNEMTEAFERMDDRSARQILRMAIRYAQEWPRRAELRVIGAQFECLGFEVSCLDSVYVDGGKYVTVHVKAPGQMFRLPLERALHRIDEFTEPSQAWILSVLPHCYDIPEVDEPSVGCTVFVFDRGQVDASRSRPGRKTSNRAAAPRAKKSKPAATVSA